MGVSFCTDSHFTVIAQIKLVGPVDHHRTNILGYYGRRSLLPHCWGNDKNIKGRMEE